jgi:hypothetical protein
MPADPNAAEPVKPRRRWFQFRLRTLLIGVALLAAICAAWAQTIHERQIVQRRDAWVSGHQQCRAPWLFGAYCHRFAERNVPADPSWFRVFLGDHAFDHVVANADENGENGAIVREVRAIFPEAEIWLID